MYHCNLLPVEILDFPSREHRQLGMCDAVCVCACVRVRACVQACSRFRLRRNNKNAAEPGCDAYKFSLSRVSRSVMEDVAITLMCFSRTAL